MPTPRGPASRKRAASASIGLSSSLGHDPRGRRTYDPGVVCVWSCELAIVQMQSSLRRAHLAALLAPCRASAGESPTASRPATHALPLSGDEEPQAAHPRPVAAASSKTTSKRRGSWILATPDV